MQYIYGSDKDGFDVLFSNANGTPALPVVHEAVNKKMSAFSIGLADNLMLFFPIYLDGRHNYVAAKRQRNEYVGSNSYILSVNSVPLQETEFAGARYNESFGVKFPTAEKLERVVKYRNESSPFGTETPFPTDAAFLQAALPRVYQKQKLVVKLAKPLSDEDFFYTAKSIIYNVMQACTIKMKQTLTAGASMTVRGLEDVCDLSVYPYDAAVSGALVYGQSDTYNASGSEDATAATVVSHIMGLTESEREVFFTHAYRFFEKSAPFSKWSQLCYEYMVCAGIAPINAKTVTSAFVRCKNAQGFDTTYEFVRTFAKGEVATLLSAAISTDINLAEVGKRLAASLKSAGFEATMQRKEIIAALRLPWLMYNKNNPSFVETYNTLIFSELDKHFAVADNGNDNTVEALQSLKAATVSRKEHLTEAFAVLDKGSAEESFYLRAVELLEQNAAIIDKQLKQAEAAAQLNAKHKAILDGIAASKDFRTYYVQLCKLESSLSDAVKTASDLNVWKSKGTLWLDEYAAVSYNTARALFGDKAGTELTEAYNVLQRVKDNAQSVGLSSHGLDNVLEQLGKSIRVTDIDKKMVMLKEYCLHKKGYELNALLQALDNLQGSELEYAKGKLESTIKQVMQSGYIRLEEEFGSMFCRNVRNGLARSQSFRPYAAHFSIAVPIINQLNTLKSSSEVNEIWWQTSFSSSVSMFLSLNKARQSDPFFTEEFNLVCDNFADAIKVINYQFATSKVGYDQTGFRSALSQLDAAIKANRSYFTPNEELLAETVRDILSQPKGKQPTRKQPQVNTPVGQFGWTSTQGQAERPDSTKQSQFDFNGITGASATANTSQDKRKKSKKRKYNAGFFVILSAICIAIATLIALGLWLLLR